MSFENDGSDIPISQFRVAPGAQIDLTEHATDWAGTPAMAALSERKLKKNAKKFLKARVAELADAQERLYADDRYSLLLIFQARDAAGKDSTIKHVMSGVNPQGCQVHSFKAPPGGGLRAQGVKVELTVGRVCNHRVRHALFTNHRGQGAGIDSANSVLSAINAGSCTGMAG